MGVQSTRYITRKQAEEMMADQLLEFLRPACEKTARDHTNKELEDGLESTFDNYIITDEE